MKKYIFASLVMLAAAASADTPTYNLNIQLKDGTSVAYAISDIDRMTFTEATQTAGPVQFAIPTSFTNSYVKKVMSGSKQVAEVCLEYIKAIDKQVTVVYPCDADGKADLTKGLTSTGATVVWDLTANTATVGAEGTALTTVYVVDGALATTFEGEAAAANVVDDILVDRRGTETNQYAITKIGTQYWMAENLRATKFADGSDIEKLTGSQLTEWAANTTGCYLENTEADYVNMAGLLYNGFCVTNEKGIAPAGWEVPTQAQLDMLKTAANKKPDNLKSDVEMSWMSGQTGNNMTGFSAIATGYFTTANAAGWTEEMTQTWFWSSTIYYDKLTKGDNLDYMRLTGTAKSITVSSSALGGHSLQFGHCIRCVRK